jgi:hypothetical protein
MQRNYECRWPPIRQTALCSTRNVHSVLRRFYSDFKCVRWNKVLTNVKFLTQSRPIQNFLNWKGKGNRENEDFDSKRIIQDSSTCICYFNFTFLWEILFLLLRIKPNVFLSPSEYFKIRNLAVPCLLWLVATLSPRRHLIRSQINSCEFYGGRNSTETRSETENVINWTFRNTKHIWEYQHKFLLKSASLAYRGTNLCLVGVDGRWLINNFYNHRIKINPYFIAPVAFCVDFDWLLRILFNREFGLQFRKTFLSLW